jgi:pyridoxine/pyridoxamine 5'-phosphate oxidase
MVRGPDPEAASSAVIAGNRYMTLATADEHGLPWASPVWYSTVDERVFFWVSSPEARHSRNLAARPEVAIVIFDSQVAVGSAQAVYMSALARQVDAADIDAGLEIFNVRSLEQGLRPWTSEDVRPPAKHRLYRATATERFALSPRDERIPLTGD